MEELEYRIALSLVPQIGCVQARILLEKFGTATHVFQAKRSQLENTEGIGSIRAEQLKGFNDFNRVGKEIQFLEKFSIRPIFILDDDYPKRLLNCYDPPVLLYRKGNADLNAGKMIAVIGTRSPTDYGYALTESLLQSLAGYAPTIVSGLALGIDAAAHRHALQTQVPTIAVLAHGLAHLYPDQHRLLARQIIEQEGGLLTEFPSMEKPSKHHFPNRNRIVAGLCDAVVIIESGIKGGSMVTASLAYGYQREIYTFPGRTHDVKSAGCNKLVSQQQAQLLTSPDDLIDALGWSTVPGKKQAVQTALPLTISEEEKKILAYLQEKGTVGIDELHLSFPQSGPALASTLLSLEMQGLIRSLPGKQFSCS